MFFKQLLKVINGFSLMVNISVELFILMKQPQIVPWVSGNAKGTRPNNIQDT